MDCEKFETAMLDELYGELDELTSAAAKRHIAGCARCSARIGALRATRRTAAMRLVDPPIDLEDRILAAADRAWKTAPRRPRLAQLVSLAGSWAMLPQTAMAAVFLVMIGTSLLLLRTKSERLADTGRVTVTEHGTPAPAMTVEPTTPRAERIASSAPSVAVAPETKQAAVSQAKFQGAFASPPPARASAESKAAAASGAVDEPSARVPFDTALESYQAGRFDDAARFFDALAPGDPDSALWAARAVRDGQGCGLAVARFDRTARQARQSPPGWDALLEGALCYRQLGDFPAARARLSALLNVDSHKDRARAELGRLDPLQSAAQTVADAPVAKATSRQRAAPASASPGAAPAPAAPPSPGAASGARGE